MNNAKTQQHGFTLIEVQIVLLLLLLIAAMVISSLYTTTKTSRTLNALYDHQQDKRIISSFLQQTIQTILPIKALERGEIETLFRGEPDQIHFLGHLPDQVVPDGPWLIRLYIEQKALKLGYRAVALSQSIRDNLNGEYQSMTLIPEIDSLSIQYYQQDRQRWLDRWSDPKSLPSAIRIKLSQQYQQWPDLTVTLHSHLGAYSRFKVLRFEN